MCVFCEVFQPGHCVMVESHCLGGREQFKKIAWEEVKRIRVLWWLLSVLLHARQKGETPSTGSRLTIKSTRHSPFLSDCLISKNYLRLCIFIMYMSTHTPVHHGAVWRSEMTCGN